MKKLFILLLLLSSGQAFSQLYFAKNGWFNFYADIRNDSAYVEVFLKNPYHFTYTITEDHLVARNNSGDTTFSGRQTHIVKRKNKLYIVLKNPAYKNCKQNKLELCLMDERELLRKRSYITYIGAKLRRFEDSLSGPVRTINVNVNNSLSHADRAMAINKVKDSLIREITKLKDPTVDVFYNAMDSLSKMDSSRIYTLLSNAKYNYFYGRYLLYRVAIERPEYLIRYIDKDPNNKNILLRTIRDHEKQTEMLEKVKGTTYNTKGKKEILKQRSKRKLNDIAIGTFYITLLLSEIALLTLVAVWIF